MRLHVLFCLISRLLSSQLGCCLDYTLFSSAGKTYPKTGQAVVVHYTGKLHDGEGKRERRGRGRGGEEGERVREGEGKRVREGGRGEGEGERVREENTQYNYSVSS